MKFFVLYRVPLEVMAKWKAETSPEEMQKQNADMGAQMGAWIEKHKGSITDMGNPLGKNTRLTAKGAEQVSNDLNFYHVVEAENAGAVAAMFADNPHLTVIPESYLDIMEIPHMGM